MVVTVKFIVQLAQNQTALVSAKYTTTHAYNKNENNNVAFERVRNNVNNQKKYAPNATTPHTKPNKNVFCNKLVCKKVFFVFFITQYIGIGNNKIPQPI